MVQRAAKGRYLVRCEKGHEACLEAYLLRHPERARPCQRCQISLLGRQSRKDISAGTVFGAWTVVGREGSRGWLCRCQCGKTRVFNSLKKVVGGCRSCRNEARRRVSDLVGEKFGDWTVIGPRTKKGRDIFWRCRCSCGEEHVVGVATLRKGTSSRCLKCSNVRRVVQGKNGIIGFTRAPAHADRFGAKKRAVQQEFWASVPRERALVFVETDIAEWQLMQDLQFDAASCVALADRPGKIKYFTRRCYVAGIQPPGHRFGTNLIGSIRKQNSRTQPFIHWLSSHVVGSLLTAHLDFCCSLSRASSAITTFLGSSLLTDDKAQLAITVSYRGEDWLTVWKQVKALVAAAGFKSNKVIPYTDTGAPMLFTTFQKSNGQLDTRNN